MKYILILILLYSCNIKQEYYSPIDTTIFPHWKEADSVCGINERMSDSWGEIAIDPLTFKHKK